MGQCVNKVRRVYLKLWRACPWDLAWNWQPYLCSKICTGKVENVVIFEKKIVHNQIRPSRFEPVLSTHPGQQKFPKFLSRQSSGISGFSSHFCLHRDQAFDMNFPDPVAANEVSIYKISKHSAQWFYLLLELAKQLLIAIWQVLSSHPFLLVGCIVIHS